MPALTMRRALTPLSWLCLAFGCARPPSTVALGGEEWLAPERHVDRGAASAASAVARQGAAASPAVVGPSATPNAPATPTAARITSPPLLQNGGELRFAYGPLPVGSKVSVRTRYSARAELASAFEDTASGQRVEVDSRERIEIGVLSGNADGARELSVEYAESKSSFRLSGALDDEDSNAGKRYRVSLGDSAPRVRAEQGALEGGEESRVLFDLATVTGYVPVLKRHLPATLRAGWQAKVSGADLRVIFGRAEIVDFEAASLALRGQDAAEPGVAVFDCALPVRVEREGLRFALDLRGTCSMRAALGRPLRLQLHGPLKAEGVLPIGSMAVVGGSFEVQLDHSYSP